MTTIDGPQRFLDLLNEVAGNADRMNALIGVGLVLKTGTVQAGPPDVMIAIDGESSMGGPLVFEDSKGDLLVPEDMTLVPGDTVVLAPMSKRQWVVLKKSRDPVTSPGDRVKIGINLDRSGGVFAGIEIVLNPDGTTTVNIQADTVMINGIVPTLP